MALQSSGVISLNDLHVEAGGSSVSGTACTINDADIRALIGKGSGVSMNIAEWYGASSYTPPALGTHKITATLAYIQPWGYAVFGPGLGATFTVHGGYQHRSIHYIAMYGTSTGTNSGSHSPVSITINTMYEDMWSPHYSYNHPRTLFNEMDSTSSRMAITDTSNNLLWIGDFSGSPISGLPSSIGTGNYGFVSGPCIDDDHYRWTSVSNLTFNWGTTYRFHFASS
jgi:hypothetical protein